MSADFGLGGTLQCGGANCNSSARCLIAIAMTVMEDHAVRGARYWPQWSLKERRMMRGNLLVTMTSMRQGKKISRDAGQIGRPL